MVSFGVVGLLGNLDSRLVLTRGKSGTFNMLTAVLEVPNDALGPVAVLVAAAVIALTCWQRADAVVSILIGLLILTRTLRLLRETAEVLREATPRGLDLCDVRAHLPASSPPLRTPQPGCRQPLRIRGMGRLLPDHGTAVSLLYRPPYHNNVIAPHGESCRRREARACTAGRPSKP